MDAWGSFCGRGDATVRCLSSLRIAEALKDLYSLIEQPAYDKFRESLMPLTLGMFVEHISVSLLDDPDVEFSKKCRIRNEMRDIFRDLERDKRRVPDLTLSSPDADLGDEMEVEDPAVGNEAEVDAMGVVAESKDDVKAVDEAARGMNVNQTPEAQPTPERAAVPAEPTPEPVPEPAT